jgi:cytoskeletal protein RodZ
MPFVHYKNRNKSPKSEKKNRKRTKFIFKKNKKKEHKKIKKGVNGALAFFHLIAFAFIFATPFQQPQYCST